MGEDLNFQIIEGKTILFIKVGGYLISKDVTKELKEARSRARYIKGGLKK